MSGIVVRLEPYQVRAQNAFQYWFAVGQDAIDLPRDRDRGRERGAETGTEVDKLWLDKGLMVTRV